MIEIIFEDLRDIGIVKSSDQFSAEWLGQEKSYLRCLKSKRRRPSTKVLATCAVRLLRGADRLGKSQTAIAQAKSAELRRLATSCLDEILTIGAQRG